MAIEPVTREERFLAAAGGQSVTPPTPITRKEQLLQGIIDAVKPGGATPDVIVGAVNDYLNANPVQPGATTEQAAQIEQNKTDIADLQAEIEDKQPKGDYVKTVNGNKPDATGNVVVATGGNGPGQNVNQYAFLNGLKYYALGDSITEIQGTTADPKLFGNWYTTDLQGRDLREITVSGYVQAIESRYGLTATNYGKSGHTLVGDFSTLVTKDYSDVALVTIAYGVNDARTGVPLGAVNSTDTATFAGALNQLLRKIYTDNPECRVLVLAPLQRLYVSEFGIATPNANGNYLIDFVNMCRAIAEKRSTAFLDQYRCAGINQTNLYYYTVEGVHPVNQGFNRIKNAVIGILDELFAVEYNPFGTMTNTGDTEPDEPEVDNGGGTETPPTEDTTGGSIDLTGLFVLDKVIYDGYVADGKRIGESGYQANSPYVSTEATELPAGRVYTITTYLGHNGVYAGYVHTAPERQKWDEDQGKYVPNGIGATISTGSATVEEVTIDGAVYRKLTYSADASKATKYAWIGCKRGMEDRVTVTYV